jgi:cation diffusion facilitator family transporter
LDRVKITNRVSFMSIVLNVLLSVGKVFAGIVGNSGAMVADGIHSVSDVFSTVIAMIGVRISVKEEDENHPYGHEKFEPVMGKILANVLIITAVLVVYNGIKGIGASSVKVPKAIALLMAIISILVKEWMYRFAVKAANKINSSVLKADAWHHRSDALSSIGSLIGIAFGMMGYPVMDAVAAIVIGILVLKVGIDIYIASIKELTDTAAPDEVVCDIKTTVMGVEGVLDIDLLKTRNHAHRLYVDLEIACDSTITLLEAHEIAENVHDSIEKDFPLVKHCMVHVNPHVK